MTKIKKHINAHTNQRKIGDKHRVHPNSLKNLNAPYSPGESGNPNGRPIKNKDMIKRLKAIGDEKFISSIDEFLNPIETNSITKRETVMQEIWKRAQNGDISSINLLIKYDCL